MTGLQINRDGTGGLRFGIGVCPNGGEFCIGIRVWCAPVRARLCGAKTFTSAALRIAMHVSKYNCPIKYQSIFRFESCEL